VLHDIGYAPDLVKSGLHPLDGARYLREVAHADEPSCSWWRIIRARPKRAV
jgi:hypothetical protein